MAPTTANSPKRCKPHSRTQTRWQRRRCRRCLPCARTPRRTAHALLTGARAA